MEINQGWLVQVERCVSSHFNQRPCDIDTIIIHNISLPPGEFSGQYVKDFFCGKLDISHHPYFDSIKHLNVASHVFIDREGQITQFVSFLDRAWHAGESHFKGRDKCNDFAIGIELEGTDTEPYTDSQYQTLVQLTKCLMAEYPNIVKDRIVGHSDVAPGRKTDPGPAFDWQAFLSQI